MAKSRFKNYTEEDAEMDDLAAGTGEAFSLDRGTDWFVDGHRIEADNAFMASVTFNWHLGDKGPSTLPVVRPWTDEDTATLGDLEPIGRRTTPKVESVQLPDDIGELGALVRRFGALHPALGKLMELAAVGKAAKISYPSIADVALGAAARDKG